MGRLASILTILTVCFLPLTGCVWVAHPKPSFLIVAVENLSSESLDCSSRGGGGDRSSDGLAALCADGVRFTHAYTTSVLSQPALASVLTGLYPIDHQVHQNGDQYLSEKFTTVSQAALQEGYRTAFFSGGPPIFRRSGFAKGFEVFDDDVIPTARRLYRPFAHSSRRLLNWIDENPDRPFFATVYVPDLQFVSEAPNGDAQIDVFLNTLSDLVRALKKRGLWRGMNVVLVGLNGVPDENRGDIGTLNLFSENTRVFFLFKPAHKDRDRGNSWSIDANVSLADLGATLFHLLHDPTTAALQTPLRPTLKAISFASALEGPNVSWPKNRLILIESGWASWRGVGLIRYAFRLGDLLYIYDNPPRIFNSLTDRFEVQNISADDPEVERPVSVIQTFIDKNKMKPFVPIPEDLRDKVIVAEELFSDDEMSADVDEELSRLLSLRPRDLQIAGWSAWRALNEKNWHELESLGKVYHEPAWIYIAETKLGKKSTLPFGERRRIAHEIFSARQEGRRYEMSRLLRAAVRENFSNGLSWDTILDLKEPSLAELARAIKR